MAWSLQGGERNARRDPDLVRALSAWRDEVVVPPSAETAERHLRAITTAALVYGEAGPPRPVRRTTRLMMRATALSGAKLVIGASMAVAATAGLATTGAIPPLQEAMVGAIESLGWRARGVLVPGPVELMGTAPGAPGQLAAEAGSTLTGGGLTGTTSAPQEPSSLGSERHGPVPIPEGATAKRDSAAGPDTAEETAEAGQPTAAEPSAPATPPSETAPGPTSDPSSPPTTEEPPADGAGSDTGGSSGAPGRSGDHRQDDRRDGHPQPSPPGNADKGKDGEGPGPSGQGQGQGAPGSQTGTGSDASFTTTSTSSQTASTSSTSTFSTSTSTTDSQPTSPASGPGQASAAPGRDASPPGAAAQGHGQGRP